MRWVLIFWMFVISAVAYLDRVNISIAGAFIEKEFGLDHVHLGWALSAFLIGYAISQAPGGRLASPPEGETAARLSREVTRTRATPSPSG